MAAKAALAFLLLATATAYRGQRVPIDARRSHVVAAERRRRFNAAAALISAAAAAPSTARAITWKVRDRRPLHSDESRRWREGGSDSTRRILVGRRCASTRRRHPNAGRPGRRQRRVHGQVPESHFNRVWNCARSPRLVQGRHRPTGRKVSRGGGLGIFANVGSNAGGSYAGVSRGSTKSSFLSFELTYMQ